MHNKSDKVEKDKRVRIVAEWILDDWTGVDIITQVTAKWNLSERQAKRYIKDARETVIKPNEQENIEYKRKKKLMTLYKLKRSLKSEWTGTPQGINAVMSVEREIIKLEALEQPLKVEHTGKDGEPIKTETTHKVVFEDYG